MQQLDLITATAQPAAPSETRTAEKDAALAEVKAMLRADITADRCRHWAAPEIALWLFRNGTQIGSVSESGRGDWKANRCFAGLPISEKRYDSLREAVRHVTEQTFVDEQPAHPWETLTRNQRCALRLLGIYTAGRFDVWQTAGNAKASARAHIMSELNGKRTPQSKSGVTAMQKAFYALAGIHGNNGIREEDSFLKWARAMDVYRYGESAEAAKQRLSL